VASARVPRRAVACAPAATLNFSLCIRIWEVTAGETRPSSHHETDRLALAWAREILRQSGGGRVVCYDRRGQVRDSETV
jgi:uncharacterized protein DUF2188